MKTKHFCMLMLTMFMFAACEKSEKLSAPSGLQGQQMGSTIVLAWNRVDGASNYEIQRNGMFLGSVNATNYTDNNPDNGYNSYEVIATDGQSRSQAANVNVYFDGGGNINNQHSTTPLSSVKMQDLIGYWEIVPYGEQSRNWYLQFNSDGTFLEEYNDKSTLKSYGVGVWNLQGGILNIQYYWRGSTRFFYSDQRTTHTLYITQYSNSSAEFYLPESTVRNDYYFTLQRLSYSDQAFSGNVSAGSTGGITKNRLVGTWLYADKSGAHYYTFKDNNNYNHVLIYGFESHQYNNYNGIYTLSSNTINVTIQQLIEAYRSGENSAGFNRKDVYMAEQFIVQSCDGSSIVWKENGAMHRCIKVQQSSREVDN